MSRGDNTVTIFRVKVTQLEMLRDRGYNISDEQFVLDLAQKDPNQAHKLYFGWCQEQAQKQSLTIRQIMTKIYTSLDGQHKVLVYYPETPEGTSKIGKPVITQIILKIREENLFHVIIISDAQLSPEAQKEFTGLPSYRMEHFLYQEMIFNPTKNYRVPEHRILSPKEAQELLKTSSQSDIDFNNFPVISFEDRISRHYGAVPGQVFEIIRKPLGFHSMVSNYKTYRVVTPAPLT